MTLLVQHEGDQQDRGDEDAPSRSGESLALHIYGHPAGHYGVADRAEDEQEPCNEGRELDWLVYFLIFVDDGDAPRVDGVLHVGRVDQRLAACMGGTHVLLQSLVLIGRDIVYFPCH